MSISKNKKAKKQKEGIDKFISSRLPRTQKLAHTTFNLSGYTHETIKELAKYYSISNAELFDTMTPLKSQQEKENTEKVLGRIPQQSDSAKKNPKSYVINNFTLSKVKEAAATRKISRDAIVEEMVMVAKLLLDRFCQSSKETYKCVLEGGYEDVQLGLESSLQMLEEAEDCMKEDLIEDDSMLLRLSKVIAELRGLVGDMRAYITEEKAD